MEYVAVGCGALNVLLAALYASERLWRLSAEARLDVYDRLEVARQADQQRLAAIVARTGRFAARIGRYVPPDDDGDPAVLPLPGRKVG